MIFENDSENKRELNPYFRERNVFENYAKIFQAVPHP